MNSSIFGNYAYISSTETDFTTAITQTIANYKVDALPVRLVFFSNPAGNDQYGEELNIIRSVVSRRWGAASPMLTYVAQPPLCGEKIIMEVHAIQPGSNDRVEYKTAGTTATPYISISGDWGRKLVTGGIQAGDLNADMRSQSDEVFEIINRILAAESMKPQNIIRQWNYLERITGFDDDVQRYQSFNDSRSNFYASGDWSGGYPAATGIGTEWGGVCVELDAYDTIEGIGIKAIDNSLQIAAHDYSKQVLLGEGKRSTPKFERAKAIWDGEAGLVYVSGTAAIRGEASLTDSGIEEQTAATLENIDFLTGTDNLADYGVDQKGGHTYRCLRVYLKGRGDLEAARKVIARTHGDIPAVYVLSDVCRCELLIEIEGILTINY